MLKEDLASDGMSAEGKDLGVVSPPDVCLSVLPPGVRSNYPLSRTAEGYYPYGAMNNPIAESERLTYLFLLGELVVKSANE